MKQFSLPVRESNQEVLALGPIGTHLHPEVHQAAQPNVSNEKSGNGQLAVSPANSANLNPMASARRPPMANGRPQMELFIEELVLHGFAASDRYRIAEALETELKELLSNEGVPPHWRDGLLPPSCSFQVAPGEKPHRIGRALAHTLFHGGMAK